MLSLLNNKRDYYFYNADNNGLYVIYASSKQSALEWLKREVPDGSEISPFDFVKSVNVEDKKTCCPN